MHIRSRNLIRVCDHTFILDNIAKDSIVVDLGMNKGEFSAWIVQHTRARCYGAEPVPELFESLPRSEQIAAWQVAIGGKAGTQKLRIHERLCASLSHTKIVDSSREIDVDVVTLPFFLKKCGIDRIDLLKIDIEGAEIDVIRTMDDELFKKIRQITIEFHDFMKSSDLPIVKDLIQKIESHGFFVINFGWKHFTDVMCLNRRFFEVDLIATLGLYLLKYRSGISRMLRRQIMKTD